MPTEDPRGYGSKRDGLRVGGWLTPPGRPARPGRLPLVTPPPSRVPVFRPSRDQQERRPAALPVAAFARIEHPRQVRLRIAITCLAVAVAGTGAFVVLADRVGTASPIQQIAVADPVMMGAVPPPPAPASPAPATTQPSSGPATNSSPAQRPAPAPAAGRRTTTTTPPPPARPIVSGLRVGDTVSLVVQGQSDLRVRHENFVGRVDRIGPASSPLDHADSAFVVRPAPTGGCVALESVNYPGFFLRHRDFVIHLDRADGSPLFRLDSAFCPVAAAGGSFRLRSANYPGRYLTAVRSNLLLSEVPASQATAFAVSAPY